MLLVLTLGHREPPCHSHIMPTNQSSPWTSGRLRTPTKTDSAEVPLPTDYPHRETSLLHSGSKDWASEDGNNNHTVSQWPGESPHRELGVVATSHHSDEKGSAGPVPEDRIRRSSRVSGQGREQVLRGTHSHSHTLFLSLSFLFGGQACALILYNAPLNLSANQIETMATLKNIDFNDYMLSTMARTEELSTKHQFLKIVGQMYVKLYNMRQRWSTNLHLCHTFVMNRHGCKLSYSLP